MSLLQALHAATTLAAVKDLLATQVLTTEDLATADVYDLTQAIRDKGAAPTVFTVDDLDDRFIGTPQEAADWLVSNRNRLGDILTQRGYEALHDLMSYDGKLAPEDDEADDDADGVEALIYGDAGHPSRARELNPGDIDYLKSVGYTVNHRGEGWVFNDPDGNDDSVVFTLQTTAWLAAKRDEATRPGAAGEAEGDRTVLFSDRNGYFYVDEVQGGERYTIATGLTQDQANAIEAGTPVSDFKWTLKRDNRTDAYFDTYTDAHNAANSGGATPFRIIPPLAERDPDTDYGEG